MAFYLSDVPEGCLELSHRYFFNKHWYYSPHSSLSFSSLRPLYNPQKNDALPPVSFCRKLSCILVLVFPCQSLFPATLVCVSPARLPARITPSKSAFTAFVFHFPQYLVSLSNVSFLFSSFSLLDIFFNVILNLLVLIYCCHSTLFSWRFSFHIAIFLITPLRARFALGSFSSPALLFTRWYCNISPSRRILPWYSILPCSIYATTSPLSSTLAPLWTCFHCTEHEI